MTPDRLGSGVRRRRGRLAIALILLVGAFSHPGALAQGLTRGSYYWYVPEHERYGRTSFYSQPSFRGGTVRITRTQRFMYGPGRRGWVLLEFDVAGKAYIHLRVLRTLIHDPAASDPWYEFKRASVFAEEPAKIEARLKGPAIAPAPVVDSKLPAWKRYKDSWGLKSGRSVGATGVDETDSDATRQPTSRPLPGSSATKARNRYPLLPPIGFEPQQDQPRPESTARDPDAATSQ